VSDLDELPELLRRWDRAVMREVSALPPLVPEAQARGSVLRRGASEAEISAAEQRLGVRFPELYRAFLTLSNGAHAGEGGPDLLQRGEQFRPTGLPVQEIVPLEVGAPVLWNVYGKGRGWRPGEAREQEPLKDGWPVMTAETTAVRDALLISHVEQNATLMLVPIDGDWQVWVEEHTGPEAFASLASWLRWQLRLLDPGPSAPFDPEAQLADFHDDDVARRVVAAFAAHGDPRWFDLAVQLLSDPTRREETKTSVAATMRLAGDPRSVAPLREALPTITEPWARMTFLRALDFCGEEGVLQEMHDEVTVLGDPKLQEWMTRYVAWYLAQPGLETSWSAPVASCVSSLRVQSGLRHRAGAGLGTHLSCISPRTSPWGSLTVTARLSRPTSLAGSLTGAAHANPSGSVKGPASLPITSRCDPDPSAETPASLARARRLYTPSLMCLDGAANSTYARATLFATWRPWST
jgi:SMI1 / KNR4 family (SUKH-1)